MPQREGAQQEGIQASISRLPVKVVAWYLVVGGLWIAFSDSALGSLVHDTALITRLQIVKGWCFLAVTGVLLYLLIRRGLSIISRNNAHLASREAHFRMLFEKMENGFSNNEIICSASGEPVDFRLLEVNPAFKRLFGVTGTEPAGKTAGELFPAVEPFWIQTLGKVALTGEPVHFGGYLKDVGRYFELSAFSTEPGRFAVLFSDVTEKRLVDIELSKLQQALEERVAQRTAQLTEANELLKQEIVQRTHAEEEISWLNADLMRQKSDLEAANRELEAFSFSVSHDLRAPLRHIAGFTRVLQEEYACGLDETGKNYLIRIVRSCENLGTLIDDLLELARIARSEMHLRRLDLSLMAERVADDLRQTDAQRRVIFHIAPGVEAMGDETLMGILLQNLLGNAYKYTGKKEEAVIEFGSRMDDGKEVYYVRDNGAGFDMNYADRLFSAFQRLHRREEFEGTGVGLAIVQRIVHRHGGQIRGVGEPQQGATFTFTLGH